MELTYGHWIVLLLLLANMTKDLVPSLRSSATTALAVSVWEIVARLHELLYLIQGAHHTTTISRVFAHSVVQLSLTTIRESVVPLRAHNA